MVSTDGHGQLVSEPFCKEVEELVTTKFKPGHWFHNITFSNECSLEFDINHKGGSGIKFQVERFMSTTASKKEFESAKDMFDGATELHAINTGTKIGDRHYSKKGFWNQALFYDSNGPLLLRKEKSVVTIFCDLRSNCEEIEEKLRTNPKLFVF